MAKTGASIFALTGLLVGPAYAECPVTNFEAAQYELSAVPPVALDLALRPVRPACLSGLSRPEHESCSRDEIADYGAAAEIWVAAMNAYANETNRFANEVAIFANKVVDYAEKARFFADAALDFRNCEVEVMTGASKRQ